MNKGVLKVANTLLAVIGAVATTFTCVLAILAFAAPRVFHIILPPFGSTPEPQTVYVTVLAPTPEPQIVYVTVLAPTHASSSPQESPPTDTPQPTSTVPPTATSTPKTADTSPGTILEVGEPWVEEGLWLEVISVEYTTWGLLIRMHVTNRSGSEIVFEWTGQRIVLWDNLENRYDNVCGSRSVVLGAGDTYDLACSNYGPPLWWKGKWWFDQNVTDLRLVVKDFARINEAQWHISVPH